MSSSNDEEWLDITDEIKAAAVGMSVGQQIVNKVRLNQCILLYRRHMCNTTSSHLCLNCYHLSHYPLLYPYPTVIIALHLHACTRFCNSLVHELFR